MPFASRPFVTSSAHNFTPSDPANRNSEGIQGSTITYSYGAAGSDSVGRSVRIRNDIATLIGYSISSMARNVAQSSWVFEGTLTAFLRPAGFAFRTCYTFIWSTVQAEAPLYYKRAHTQTYMHRCFVRFPLFKPYGNGASDVLHKVTSTFVAPSHRLARCGATPLPR